MLLVSSQPVRRSPVFDRNAGSTKASTLVTVVPALENVGAVFGLGLIVWFTALGRTLIKDGPRSLDDPRLAASLSV